MIPVGRFCASDVRCGLELDEINPAEWAKLEAATDDYIAASQPRFQDCADLLLSGIDADTAAEPPPPTAAEAAAVAALQQDRRGVLLAAGSLPGAVLGIVPAVGVAAAGGPSAGADKAPATAASATAAAAAAAGETSERPVAAQPLPSPFQIPGSNDSERDVSTAGGCAADIGGRAPGDGVGAGGDEWKPAAARSGAAALGTGLGLGLQAHVGMVGRVVAALPEWAGTVGGAAGRVGGAVGIAARVKEDGERVGVVHFEMFADANGLVLGWESELLAVAEPSEPMQETKKGPETSRLWELKCSWYKSACLWKVKSFSRADLGFRYRLIMEV